MTVRGRNLITGLPETLEISSIEIRDALSDAVETIIAAAKDVVDDIPAEMLGDVMDNGICLSGGGALLQGLAERMSEDLHVRCWVADDPMTAVARGAGKVLEDLEANYHLLLRLD
jgi:rod shape-determining protein MreB